jgi:hypothetical protein
MIGALLFVPMLCCTMPAGDALQVLAEGHGLSLLAVDVAAAPAYTGLIGELEPTRRAIEAECGLETAVWRGLLLACPAKPGDLRTRLEQAVDPESRALLFRPPDTGGPEVPGWEEHVVGCVLAMLTDEGSEATHEIARKAALWMAAWDAQESLLWMDALTTGKLILSVKPSVPPVTSDTTLQSREAIRGSVPVGSNYGPNQNLGAWILDARYDIYDAQIAREQAMISAEELARRSIERGLTETSLKLGETEPRPQGAFAGDPAELTAWLGGLAGITIEAPASDARQVLVQLRGARAEDVLLALAHMLGLHLMAADRSARLVAPECAYEDLDATLPLDLWSLVRLSKDELAYDKQARRRRAWAALGADGRESLLTPKVRRLADLTADARAAVTDAFLPAAAESVGRCFQCLPERDGPVPLWLFHRPARVAPSYVLASPTHAESLQGATYVHCREVAVGGLLVVAQGIDAKQGKAGEPDAQAQ